MDEYEEITLADLVDTLLRRKAVLIAAFLLCFGGAGAIAFTAEETPAFRASASQLLLIEPHIVLAHLQSDEVASQIDAYTDASWTVRLAQVEAGSGADAQMLVVQATGLSSGAVVDAPDWILGKALETESLLRQRIEQAQFDVYFAAEGKSEDDARRLAQARANEATLWLPASTTEVSDVTDVPNTKLTLALGLVLGLMVGVFAAFTAEWVANYRKR